MPVQSPLLRNREVQLTQVKCEILEAAALSLGLRLVVVEASTETEPIQPSQISQVRAPKRDYSTDPFSSTCGSLIALAAATRFRRSTIFRVSRGSGLMSYGTNITALYKQVGIYTGKILVAPSRAICPSCSLRHRSRSQPQDREGAWP